MSSCQASARLFFAVLLAVYSLVSQAPKLFLFFSFFLLCNWRKIRDRPYLCTMAEKLTDSSLAGEIVCLSLAAPRLFF